MQRFAEARGVFVSDSQALAAWVNEEDWRALGHSAALGPPVPHCIEDERSRLRELGPLLMQ